jgi:hypothetical protein
MYEIYEKAFIEGDIGGDIRGDICTAIIEFY